MIASGSSTARVVGGHDRHVGEPPRHRAHLGALAAVAVAAAAEHHDQPPAADELARRPQHVLERVGRVGVVDEHREGLAALDGSKPPGHARRPRDARARRASCGQPQQLAHGDHAERGWTG